MYVTLEKNISSIKATTVLYKQAVLKNFAKFTGKQLYWSLFLIQPWGSNTGVFPWKYCKIFKNSYFEEHLQTAACGGIRKSITIAIQRNNY